MLLSAGIVSILAYLMSASIQEPLQARQDYALTGDGFNNSSKILGNYYNYWTILDNGTIDLTRRNIAPTTSPKTLPMTGTRPSIIIEPSRSALVLIDQQNYFLHPALAPTATAGRATIPPTINMINAFRAHAMPILWTNWGLTEHDRLTMPPAFLSGFSTNSSNRANESFGSDMGTLPADANHGTPISMGRKLWRGAWNAEPYGPLRTIKDEGLKAGTDFLFHKNRLSGLRGAQTPLGMWLEDHEITTLFFGGVNTDQCVWGTFIDAYFKGYDVILVDDICGTTSPEYARQMCLYNADLDGFIANSTGIIAALG